MEHKTATEIRAMQEAIDQRVQAAQEAFASELRRFYAENADFIFYSVTRPDEIVLKE